jgi:hypothetical protein
MIDDGFCVVFFWDYWRAFSLSVHLHIPPSSSWAFGFLGSGMAVSKRWSWGGIETFIFMTEQLQEPVLLLLVGFQKRSCCLWELVMGQDPHSCTRQQVIVDYLGYIRGRQS